MPYVQFRRVAAAVCAATALAFAAPALGQSAQHEAMGVSLARDLSTAFGFKEVLIHEATAPDADVSIPGLETAPGSETLLREAVAEEIAHDMPVLEEIIGRALARRFTPQELKGVNDFMKGPGGRAFLSVIADAAAGRTSPPPSPDVQAAVLTFLASPEGRAFDAVMNDLDSVLGPIEAEVLQEVNSGAAERYKAKLAAADQSTGAVKISHMVGTP